MPHHPCVIMRCSVDSFCPSVAAHWYKRAEQQQPEARVTEENSIKNLYLDSLENF